MAKSDSEKAADGLVSGVARVDWNPQLFCGYLFQQDKRIQRMIVLTMLMFLRQYKENALNEHLAWRIDPETNEYIEPIDLTGYDQ